jgi:hypothetical protein
MLMPFFASFPGHRFNLPPAYGANDETLNNESTMSGVKCTSFLHSRMELRIHATEREERT